MDTEEEAAAVVGELSTSLSSTHLSSQTTPPAETPPKTDMDTPPVQPTNNKVKKLSRSTAIDEEQQLLDFLRETMLKSLKDRNIILRIEADLVQFVKEKGKSNLPFPSMSSYHRMLVHRISSLFNLDHNIDPIANCVVVSKTGGEKLIDFRFKELLESGATGASSSELQGCRVLQREEQENKRYYNNKPPSNSSSSLKKSYEQRSLDYNQARHRIFQEQSSSSQIPIKVESFDEGQIRRGTGRSNKFGKSSSFGGYGNGHQNSHALSQYPTQSSISPASSGYKSLQIMSTSTSCSSSQDYFCESDGQLLGQQQQQQQSGQQGEPPSESQYYQQPHQQPVCLPIIQQSNNYPVQHHQIHPQQYLSSNNQAQYLIPQQLPPPPPPTQQNIIYYVPITSQQLQQVQQRFVQGVQQNGLIGGMVGVGQQQQVLQQVDPYWQQVQVQQMQVQQQQQYYQTFFHPHHHHLQQQQQSLTYPPVQLPHHPQYPPPQWTGQKYRFK